MPAYRACTSPSETHGPPLAFGSCVPQQASDALTVGTFDANGANANSIGRVFLSTMRGDPATTADEADVVTRVSLSDVRCRLALAECAGDALSDYLGSLHLVATIRVTDRRSGGAERDAATAEDWISFFVPVPCTGTADTTIGSTCATQTTLDAAIPGIVGEGKRANWELGQIELRDAGIDDPRVDGGQTLAVQGLFVP